MKRLLAALTAASFLTLAVGVAGSDSSPVSLLPAAVFALLATVGFDRVQRRRHRGLAVAYVVVQFVLGYATFVTSGASIGSILLLIVLVSQSVLLLPLHGVAVVVAVVPFVHAGMSWRDGLREGLGMLAAAAFAVLLTRLLVREQEARGELTRAHERLREYAVQAERLAAAQERNRVARDIHDGLGHYLTVVQMQVKAARAVLSADPARADAVLEKAQRQAEEALAEVRRSVGALREPLPAVPLPEALKALADEASATGVPTGLTVSGTVRGLPADVAESLYRAAQEGLTTVRRHARASRAELVLDYSEPAAVRLEVRDDGAGGAGDADASGAPGFGLVGVRERAAHVGGRMSIESVPGRGSTLRVEVPA